MMTQQLPTTNVQQTQQMITAAMSSSPVTLVAPPPTAATNSTSVTNSTVVNKTSKSSGQDRLVCSLCNKVYRSSAGLRYHKRKRHRGKPGETRKHLLRREISPRSCRRRYAETDPITPSTVPREWMCLSNAGHIRSEKSSGQSSHETGVQDNRREEIQFIHWSVLDQRY